MTNKVLFFDKENIHQIKWSSYKEGEKMQKYFSPLIEKPTHYIQNVNTTICFLGIDDVLIPYTVNEKEYDNSYVVSPYTHYITYAKEELSMLKQPILEKSLNKLLDAIGFLTKKIKINQVIYVNNWLLSTNLFTNLTAEQIEKETTAFVQKYPHHVIGFRSVNDRLSKGMRQDLMKNHYLSLPSRYVYLSDEHLLKQASKKAKNTLRRDEKLFKQEGIEIISHDAFTKEELRRVKELYDALYLQKYSYQNPQFTEAYIFHTHKTKSLIYQGVRVNGTLEGVFASVVYENKMANPIVGYNTALPKELGLYRMVRLLAIKSSIEHNRIYHQSAGAGRFKYDRGAVGYPEYTMIYVKHLPKSKRLFWKILSFLFEKIGVPLVEKKRL